MRFALTDEQQMLRDAVRGTLEREAPLARVRAWADTREAREPMAIAARQGWAGIGVPEDAGGQGGGLVELALVVEELARAAVPGPFLAHAGLSTALALAAGVPAAPLVGGERVTATVVDSGVPLRDVPRGVRLEGDALHGGAGHVLAAADADVLLVPIAGADGIELRAVDAGAPGLGLEPLETTDLTRNWAHVRFEGTPSAGVGRAAASALADLAPRVAVLVAADALGAAQRMLDLTVAYAGEREQFEKPIGSFQAVKHLAADMHVDVESARSAVYFAAWSVAAGHDEAAAHAAGAKAFVTPAAARVADRALAVHGAIGFTWEHDLQFFFKRVKADVPLFGTPAQHLDRVADTLELVR